MLPHSLNQMSFWMRGDTVAANPARTSNAASASTRSLVPPVGSPTIRPLPKWWRTTPGASTEQLACTTQPSTWWAGTARTSSPPGSTDASVVPSSGPPRPWVNHQGTPFMAVNTTVFGPSKGRRLGRTARRAGAFSASTTTSCTPTTFTSINASTACLDSTVCSVFSESFACLFSTRRPSR